MVLPQASAQPSVTVTAPQVQWSANSMGRPLHTKGSILPWEQSQGSMALQRRSKLLISTRLFSTPKESRLLEKTKKHLEGIWSEPSQSFQPEGFRTCLDEGTNPLRNKAGQHVNTNGAVVEWKVPQETGFDASDKAVQDSKKAWEDSKKAWEEALKELEWKDPREPGFAASIKAVKDSKKAFEDSQRAWEKALKEARTRGSDPASPVKHGTRSSETDSDFDLFDSESISKDSHGHHSPLRSSVLDAETTSCDSPAEKTPLSHSVRWDESLEEHLKDLIGMDDLKRVLQQWCKGYALDTKRRQLGATLARRKPPNMVFLGNPGTGKTKVARMLAHILYKLGAIREDKVVEVQRTDLVGRFIGQTGLKTREQMQAAKGGILFVDEAYQLVKTEEDTKDFGREALEEIMSQMDGGDPMVIFAGYAAPMRKVLDSNEGFRRRVGRIVEFPDYTPRQIVDIMTVKLAEEGSCLEGFKLAADCTPDAVAALIESRIPPEGRSKRNGGLAAALLEHAREHQDGRLSWESDDLDELITIRMEDLEAAVEQVQAYAKF